MRKKKLTTFIVAPITMSLMISSGLLHAEGAPLTPIEALGKNIFFDEDLSLNKNQSCSSCHDPAAGWTGGDEAINLHGAVFEGSVSGEFGNRKPPSSAYATLAPIFYTDHGNRLVGGNDEELAKEPLFVGGNFWDGRATGWKLGNPAADQAQGPFLNPVEQALPDSACVVHRVCTSSYSNIFKKVWSPGLCKISWPGDIETACQQADGVVHLSPQHRMKSDKAYDRVALSIAAFEGSSESNAFTAKIDAHRAGMYDFSPQEDRGHDIFRGKGKCVQCHAGAGGPGAEPPLLTDFTYDNLGVPRNPENPFSQQNPEWQDPGLANFLKTLAPYYRQYGNSNMGKQKVSTLRNVGLGSCEAEPEAENCIVKAYMHNGYFKSLKSVVHFYNTRDVLPSCEDNLGIENATEEVALANNCWPKPEVAKNVNTDELGNLGLTEEEEADLVAFLLTMSDGYFTK